ncbi:MAG: flavodoxin family protein [Bariatricus sp.]
MILIINTLEDNQVLHMTEEKLKSSGIEYELIHTGALNINPCIGCNYCWLKHPGICTIKDDYEMILKKIIHADQMWIAADTHFGFISYKGKNIVDRMMPLVTMNLHMKDGQMRHVIRYDKIPDFGVIYQGDGDKEYMNRWAGRVALNFGSSSLGAYSIEEIQEVEHAFSNH